MPAPGSDDRGGAHVVVSGMRPTGRLHVGHLEGVIRNWLALQAANTCYYFVADLHALTDRSDPGEIARWTTEMVRDWLALGIDPAKAVVFRQSDVLEHALLSTLLTMVTPVSWLERCPTYKDRVSELGEGSANAGLLGYPVLMCADVALYDADRIPVGEDQVVHLEMAREIVRRFNLTHPGADLVEPQPLLTRAAKIMGTDGRKMSKSYGNTIELAASVEVINKQIKGMKTDEKRKLRHDPGNPADCNLFPYHELYTPTRLDEIRQGCTTASLGCVDCKKILMDSHAAAMSSYREKLSAISDARVREVLEDGGRRARAVARRTMSRVMAAIGIAGDIALDAESRTAHR